MRREGSAERVKKKEGCVVEIERKDDKNKKGGQREKSGTEKS